MSRVALLLALVTIPALACEKSGGATEAPRASEDSVDALTRELLAALRDGDGERAQKLTTATLAAALDERTLATVSRTLIWLGPITALTRIDEHPVEGGVERRYRLGLERGEVELTVTVIGGEAEGFAFEEATWEALADRALEASAGSLRVVELALDPRTPAEIHYALAIEGLDAQLREHHLTIAKLVFDGGGQVVYRQRSPDDIRFPQAETGSSGGRVTGTVAVPGVGEYELELTIMDLVGGATLVHRVPLVVVAPAE